MVFRMRKAFFQLGILKGVFILLNGKTLYGIKKCQTKKKMLTTCMTDKLLICVILKEICQTNKQKMNNHNTNKVD